MRSSFRLPAIILLIVIEMIVMVIYSPSGGLTSDSMNYLRAANSMLAGHGLFVPDLYAPSGWSFFTVWPPAYPGMIAGIAWLFDLSTFTASKYVNVIIVWLICLALVKPMRQDAWLFASFFLSDTVVGIMYRSWSEVPFLLGIVLFSLSLYYFYHRKTNRWLLAVLASGLLMLFSRYIGAFCLFPIAILGCVMLRQGDWRSFAKLALCGLGILAAMVGMGYINQHFSGYASGFDRIANRQPIPVLVKIMLLKQLEDFKLVLIALAAFLILRRFKGAAEVREIEIDQPPFWPFFLLTGIMYELVVMVYRWSSYFDDFGTRIMIPVAVTLTFALLDYRRRRADFRLFSYCFIGLMLGACCYQLTYPALTSKQHYHTTRDQAIALYAPLEPGSIVLDGDYDMLYLRSDIQPAAPYPFFGSHGNYAEANGEQLEDIAPYEPLGSYIKRRCGGHITAIYVDSSRWQHRHRAQGYPDIAQALHDHPQQSLLKLADCRKE